MRTELDALLNVAGARWASDEIDRARQLRPAIARTGAQQVPTVLVAGNNLAGAEDNDMRIGQEVQRRRRGFARDEH